MSGLEDDRHQGGFRWFLILSGGIVLLSFYIQMQVAARTIVDHPIRADAFTYVSYAYNLRTHGVFSRQPAWMESNRTQTALSPDKLTLPGYPWAISLLLDGTPDPRFVQRVVYAQALLGVGTCLITLLLARLLLPAPLALGAGLLTAASPHLATVSSYLITESLFTFLLAASMLALVKAVQHAAPWSMAAFCGALFGLASLVRPQLQLFLPMLAVTVLVAGNWRRMRRPALIALLSFVCVIAPWQLRNAALKRPPGDPDLLVMTIYHGSFPQMMYRGDPATAGIAYRFDADGGSHTKSLPDIVRHVANSASAEPARYLGWYLLGKPALFLSWGSASAGIGNMYIYPTLASPYMASGFFKVLLAASHWLHTPVTLLAVGLSLVLTLRRTWVPIPAPTVGVLAPLAALMLYAIAMHMVGAPYPRYGIPFRPLIYILGMAALWSGWQQFRYRHR